MKTPRKPNKFLDSLKAELPARDDAHIATKIGWPQGYVSKLRHGNVSVTPKRMLEVHRKTGWELDKIKAML